MSLASISTLSLYDTLHLLRHRFQSEISVITDDVKLLVFTKPAFEKVSKYMSNEIFCIYVNVFMTSQLR